MLDVTVTVNAPELSGAMAALAAALQGVSFAPIQNGPEVIPPPAPPVLPPMPVNPTQPAPPVSAGPAIPPTVPTAPAGPASLSNPMPPPAAPPAIPAANPAPAVVPPAVPVAAAPTFTREQIMAAGAALIDAGKINELMGLLNSFGVQAVTHLKQEQLGAFATELRKLGAQI